MSLVGKTTILHVHHAFLYISFPSPHNYDVNDQILSFFEDGNGKALALQFQPKFPSFK